MTDFCALCDLPVYVDILESFFFFSDPKYRKVEVFYNMVHHPISVILD
jgi:hypothetical protein